MNEHTEVHINITFKNTEATEAIKNYANEKIINCLRKFIHKSLETHLVLRVEKTRHIAEITFHTEGHDFTAKEESADLYVSIDTLVSALTQQLRKHKERITQHH